LPVWSAYREGEPEAQELGRRIRPVPVPRREKMRVFEKVLDAEMAARAAK
jgi:hypothetical protein